MTKSVFSVDVNDARSKKAAIKAVSGLLGIESLSIDMEKKTLTVVGDVDPVEVILKLRKLKMFRVDIETVGPNEKKGDNKKEEVKDDKSKQQQEMEQIIRAHYNAYYPNYSQPYYYYPRYVSVEDEPYLRHMLGLC